MKVIYITSLFYPSTVANNRQSLHMARAFSKLLGDDFLFVISHVKNKELLSEINYAETKVARFRKFHLTSVYYALWLPFFIRRLNMNPVLYFKDENLALIATVVKSLFRFRYKVISEYHHLLNDWRDKYLLRRADFVVSITRNLKKIMVERFGIAENKIILAPDAVDLVFFDIPEGSRDYRGKLLLPLSKKIVGYVGTFSTMGMDKGVRDLISAFKMLKKDTENVFLLLAGGRGETDFYIKFAKNKGLVEGEDFVIEKYVDYSLVPKYLKACDVLVSPFPFNEHFAYYMSPLKIFEYMASKRPIITSDLPSLREILSEKEAVFFEPGNIADLSEKIRLVINNQTAYQKLAEAAFEKVKNYTWEKRAKNIVNIIN